MAINNVFSNQFWIGTGAWNQDMKAPTKEQKFPWLTAEQIEKLEEYTADLTWAEKIQMQQNLYQAVISKIEAEKYNDSRTATENERFRRCLSKSDPKERNFDESCWRQSTLVDMVKEVHDLKANTPEEQVLSMLMQEMEYRKVGVDSLNAYLDNGDEEFLYQMWLKEKPSWKWKKIASTIWIWAGVLWGTDVWLYAVNKWLEKVWEVIYDLPIDSSIQEARAVQKAWAGVKDAEVAVKDAKADLKAAKKAWEWVEEAKEALDTAKANLKAAENNKVVKVADTAREYNIWGGITEWWSAESRGIQAKSEANQIFKKTINPALENSKATVNVQELINSLGDDIGQLAKNDPDKLRAYNEALESLKESYKAPEFAEYSLKDSQTLKSWLQGRTPQKFWKWKEITNELQELKGRLSTKLTNAVHTNLTKELWEDTAKLYKDWANLTEYADDMAKQTTNAWLKQGFWNFWSSAYHKLTDGASAKLWLLLNKTGKWVAKATGVEKVADSIWDAWNYLVKNGKKLFKASKWWLKVSDPTGAVQLLRLAPWSIGEIANSVSEAAPSVIVDDLLFEIQDFKDNWNKMSDEERVQNIKDQYLQATWNELNDKSAEATYNNWKKKHPDGKYWVWDSVNDVDIVLSV